MRLKRKFNWKMIWGEVIYDMAVERIGNVGKEDVYV